MPDGFDRLKNLQLREREVRQTEEGFFSDAMDYLRDFGTLQQTMYRQGQAIVKVLEEPSNKMIEGVTQLVDNPVAGAINIQNSLLSFTASPFGIADAMVRELPGGGTVADVVAKPFEWGGQGALFLREKSGVKILERKALELTGLSEDKIKQIQEAGDYQTEMLGQFAVGGGFAKGFKSLKGKKSSVKTDVKETYNVGDVGLDKLTDLPLPESRQLPPRRINLTEVPKEEVITKSQIKLELDELANKRVELKEKIKTVKGKAKTPLIKELGETNKQIESLSELTGQKIELKIDKPVSKEIKPELSPREVLNNSAGKYPTSTAIKDAKQILGDKFETEYKSFRQKNKPVEGQDITIEEGRILEDFARKTVAANKMGIKDINIDLRGETSKYETAKTPKEVVKETPLIKEQRQETPIVETAKKPEGLKKPETAKVDEGVKNFNVIDFAKDLLPKDSDVKIDGGQISIYPSEPIDVNTISTKILGELADRQLQRAITKVKVFNPEKPKADLQKKEVKPDILSAKPKIVEKPIIEKPRETTPEGTVTPTIEKLRAEALKEYGAENKIFTKGKLEQAKKNIQSKGQQLTAGIDPTLLKDYATVGAYHFEAGARKFADWSKRMVDEFGDKIKPQLFKLWAEVQREYPKAVKEIKETETRTEKMTKYGIPESEIIKNRELMAKRESFTQKTKESLKEEKKSFRLWTRHKLKPKDTQLSSIDPELYRAVKRVDFDKEMKLRAEEKIGIALIDGIKKKIDKTTYYDLDILFKNEKEAPVREILRKHGLEKEFDAVKNLLEKYREELGIKKTKDFYFPRDVKNYDGFMEHIYEKLEAKTGKDFSNKMKDIFDRLIEEKEAKKGKELTIEEQATLINNAIRGYNPGVRLSKFKNEFERTVKVLDAEMSQYYHNFDASLMSYIEQARTKIEARNFFGKKSGDAPSVTEHSIGRMIAEGRIRSEKPLTPENIRELTEILKSGFEPRGTHGWINTVKEVGYVTRLFNYINALTQLGDYYVSLYRSPLKSVGAVARAFGSKARLTKPSKVQLSEIGYDASQMAREFSNPRQRGKLMKTTAEWSLFKGIDIGMKETFINTLNKKYTSLAKQGKLKEGHPDYWRFEKRFGKEADAVIKEFAKDEMTPRKAFQLWDELDAAQPISVWSTPPGFHTSGQMQIAYQMKTFGMRRLDFILNESKRRFMDKSLPKQERIRAGKNFFKLVAAIVLTEGSVDIAKDIIKDKEINVTDTMLDNLLGLVMMSRYDVNKIRRDGFFSALADKASPILGTFDDAFGDAIGLFSGEPRFKTIRNIPVIGEVIYNWISGTTGSRNSNRTYSRGE